MMRVIAGRLGGRQFDSPHSHRTHPMSDKMRGAMFNILGDIDGLTVLDPFGGSGALSFEAVSRGAKESLIIENDKPAQRVIAENIKALGLATVKLVKAGAGPWLETNSDARFDLVLCDPPYDDLQHNLLRRLAGSVASGGLFVLSYPADGAEPELPNLAVIKQQAYGDAQLIFYRAE
jgi:16S rRNA (guanine966-N2)-methyltransferase